MNIIEDMESNSKEHMNMDDQREVNSENDNCVDFFGPVLLVKQLSKILSKLSLILNVTLWYAEL